MTSRKGWNISQQEQYTQTNVLTLVKNEAAPNVFATRPIHGFAHPSIQSLFVYVLPQDSLRQSGLATPTHRLFTKSPKKHLFHLPVSDKVVIGVERDKGAPIGPIGCPLVRDSAMLSY